MASNYPRQIDTDVEISTINNNVSEIGGTVINSIRSAVIAIEKYVGAQQDSSVLTLSQRLYRITDSAGNLRRSAIETAGFITAPIDNSDVDTSAGIVESKLSLEYGTALLQNQINVLRAQNDAYTSEVLTIVAKVRAHVAGTAVGAHQAKNISYDVTTNTYYNSPSANPFFDANDNNVQLALDAFATMFRRHKESIITTSSPFGEHYAGAIYFDNNDVDELTESENVQGALEDAFNLYNQNMIVHRDEQHANGIVRNTQTVMGSSSGYLASDGIVVTWTQGSSIVTRAVGSFITDGVSAGDTIVIAGAADSDDDGTYQINEVTGATTLNVVKTFVAASGAGATADVYLTSREGASPVEWSCNCLNCTVHPYVNVDSIGEIFVASPGAASVFGDRIDFPALAQAMYAGGVPANQLYIFDVYINGSGGPTTVHVDLTLGGYIDLSDYWSTLSTLTTRNIIRAINENSVEGHYPFHAYEKDDNKIIIAHDGARVNSANPYDDTDDQNDVIMVDDGSSGTNDLTISSLGFSSGQVGVTTNYAFPNFNNYYYVNGERRRDLKCLTENGAYDYILVDVADDVISNFRLVDGTTKVPSDFEFRIGDVIRFVSGTASLENRSFTINNVGASITIRESTGVTESDIQMIVHRNVASIFYDGVPANLSVLYRIGVDEGGEVFKHKRLSYGASAPKQLATALKIVNCSRSLAGSIAGTAYSLISGQQVNTIFGPTIYDPADYNSLFDDTAAMTRLTLQFAVGNAGGPYTNSGEVVQVEPFNSYGFKQDTQIYRVYLADHIDWIDVEVNYNDLLALGMLAANPLKVTVYEELDEEKNLMLSSALFCHSSYSPSLDNSRFVTVDERYFGNIGDENIRSDFKDNIWEIHRGIGNYINNGLLLTISGTNLVVSGGSAFIGGHRIDFSETTITSAHLLSIGYANRSLSVCAMENGRIDVYPTEDGRPQEEHVVLGMIGTQAVTASVISKYSAADFTNLNEKLLITVSPDPKQGMFTDIESAVLFARYVLSIRDSFHDKVSANTETYGATIFVKDGKHLINSPITVHEYISIVGSGYPLIYVDSSYSSTHVFSLTSYNNIENIYFEAESGATISQGTIRVASGAVGCTIDDCFFNSSSSSIVSDVYLNTCDIVIINNCFFGANSTHNINCLNSDYVNITNNNFNSGNGIYYRNTSGTHGGLVITNNNFVAGVSTNIQIQANSTINGIIIDGNGCVISGGGTGRNIYVTGSSSLNDVKITNNTFAANSDRNLYISPTTILDLSILNNSFSNTGNGLNIDLLASSTMSWIWINDNYMSAGTNPNIGIIAVGAINGIMLDGNVVDGGGYNLYLRGSSTINDIKINENYFDTSSTTVSGIFIQNLGVAKRYLLTSNTIISSGASGVQNIIFDADALLSYIYMHNNYLYAKSTSQYNVKFDGFITIGYIINNYLQNVGDASTSYGNLEFTNSTIRETSVSNNVFVCLGDGVGVAPNIYMHSFGFSPSDIIISSNVINSTNYSNILFNPGQTFSNINVCNNTMYGENINIGFLGINDAYENINVVGNILGVGNDLTNINIDSTINYAYYVSVCNNILTGNNSIGASIIINDTTYLIVSDNLFDGGGSSTTALSIAGSTNGTISGNVFSSDFSTYIGGASITGAGAITKFNISDNWPPSTDFTFRMATNTVAASPPHGGGGEIWYVNAALPAGWTTVDDSIDWDNRYITCIATYTVSSVTGTDFRGNLLDPSQTAQEGDLSVCQFFTASGESTAIAPANSYGALYDNALNVIIALVSDDSTGFLRVWKEASITNFDIVLHIIYSPIITPL